MFDSFLGLPLHPLVVHAVVVLTPLTALAVLLFSVSERFRRWSGWLTPALGLLTTVFAFVATQSGESLESRLPPSDAIEEHAELGDLLPWVVLAATVVAAVLWFLWRRDAGSTSLRDGAPSSSVPVGAGAETGAAPISTLTKVVAVVGVVAALGLAVDVVLVGHSGSKAVWQGTPTQSQGGGDGDEG